MFKVCCTEWLYVNTVVVVVVVVRFTCCYGVLVFHVAHWRYGNEIRQSKHDENRSGSCTLNVLCIYTNAHTGLDTGTKTDEYGTGSTSR